MFHLIQSIKTGYWDTFYFSEDLIYKDKLAGFQARIQYWGANHGKNQLPPAPERWLTGIKLDVTTYELLEFGEANCPIDHFYSDGDSMTELFVIFKKYLVTTNN